jgi:steroid delta-isomerase-like uncharacterized protein
MTDSGHKALVRRYYHEILEQRNTALIDELFSPNFLAYPPLGPASTLDKYKAALAMSHHALTDIHVSIDDQIAEGEKVVTRWHATAVHQGTFAGISATGKTVTASAIHIHRIIDGKIVEFWEQIDLFGLFMQIGSFPPGG